ncbi:MAG: choice-of-anchor E domain-containing protein [Nostocaceae cyanobacterium]|nr:choice-of-anchor E domain-containing protein [Nostocaceae cyanobacterium]
MHFNLSPGMLASAVFAAILMPMTAAQAAILTSESSIPLQKTNFEKFVTLEKFDPTLGDLESVFFELSGLVEGAIELESRDAKPATVTASLAAEISLINTDNKPLLVTLPTASVTENFDAYDGKLDFDGDSGATFTGLSTSDSQSVLLTTETDWEAFIGTDSFNLPVIAKGESETTGSGNLVAGFETNAGATVKVVYTYAAKPKAPQTQRVPESQIPMGAMAALGLCMVVRKQSQNMG